MTHYEKYEALRTAAIADVLAFVNKRGEVNVCINEIDPEQNRTVLVRLLGGKYLMVGAENVKSISTYRLVCMADALNSAL